MILEMFRRHLADEIRRFPKKPGAAMQSYAVTTAILARRILEYAAINDLFLPAARSGSEDAYPLKDVLDRIIHFTALHQDMMTLGIPGEEGDLVTLYSDRAKHPNDEMYISLARYVHTVKRLAEDDRLVACHLMRKAATNLGKAANARDESTDRGPRGYRYDVFRQSLSAAVINAWHLLLRLIRSGEAHIPAVNVGCYELHYRNQVERAAKNNAFTTCSDLVNGYPRKWSWGPTAPRPIEIDSVDIFCILLRTAEARYQDQSTTLAIPCTTYAHMFQAARMQLKNA